MRTGAALCFRPGRCLPVLPPCFSFRSELVSFRILAVPIQPPLSVLFLVSGSFPSGTHPFGPLISGFVPFPPGFSGVFLSSLFCSYLFVSISGFIPACFVFSCICPVPIPVLRIASVSVPFLLLYPYRGFVPVPPLHPWSLLLLLLVARSFTPPLFLLYVPFQFFRSFCPVLPRAAASDCRCTSCPSCRDPESSEPLFTACAGCFAALGSGRFALFLYNLLKSRGGNLGFSEIILYLWMQKMSFAAKK